MTALLVALFAALRSTSSVASRARGGDSRPPASTRRPPTPGAAAPAARPRRSPPVGAALAAVAELATGRPDRHARHRRALAPARVRALLAWRSRPRRPGRPAVAADLRALIRQMQAANPLWGAPRIHGELRKLGIEIAQATVAKYLARRRRDGRRHRRGAPSSPITSSQLASIDFFTVPTATFRVLFVFVVLAHDRRRIVHVNVTAHPTAAWTAQQLREAWPWDTAPRFLLRDRDAIYGV